MKVFYIIFLLIFFPISSYCKTTLDKISPDLSYLWGVSILNDKEVLYTQRSGKIFKLNVYSKQNTEISYATERTYSLRNVVVGNNTKTSAKRKEKKLK